MIIKALEFCAGKKKSSALYSFSPLPNNAGKQKDIRINMSIKADDIKASNGEVIGIRTSRIYSRIVGESSKRSAIEIDGELFTILLGNLSS